MTTRRCGHALRFTAALMFGSCVVSHADLGAQIRSSERGSVSQTVDGTTIAIDFARPQLRGRTAFPGIVPWGETWTPGANWATTFEVNNPVKVAGKPLAAGKYSVWFVPRDGEWTVYLNKQEHIFHESRPKPELMALTLSVAPSRGASTEALTFHFPQVDRTGTTLEFRWGTSVLAFRIDVPPSLAPGTLTEATAAPYVGEYNMIEYGATKRDSTIEKMSVVLRDGRLVGVTKDPEFQFAFIDPVRKDGAIYLGFLEKGEIADIELSTPVTWTRAGGRVTGFTVGSERSVWFYAVRK